MSKPAKASGATGLVPRLRFPKFVGNDSWQQAELSTLITALDAGVSVNSGDSPASAEQVGILKTSCVADGQFDPRENKVVLDQFEAARLREPVTANTIIISRMNTPTLVGENAYVCQGFRNLFLPDRLWAAKPRTETNMMFVAQYLASSFGRNALRSLATGTSGSMKNISQDAVLQLPVPNPASGEQQKIADCLSSLDDVIAAHADKLAALKQHKQGLLEQLFPREGETVPRLRFPEFRNASDWQVSTIGAVCDVLQGYGFPLALQGKRNGRYPFCKVSDISRAVDTGGGLLSGAVNYVDDTDITVLRAVTLPVGTTVFAKIGEALRLNRRALTTVACLVDNNATGLKIKAGAGNDYFLFVLSRRIDMNEYCGGAVPSISKSTLESIPITIPTPDEQQRIADWISTLDALIAAEADRLAALKQHKQGLLQQLFPAIDDDATQS